MTNIQDNAPTPKTNLMEHFQNFGEAGMYFSGSLGLALVTVYFRQLEIVLAIAYATTLIYSILSFDDSPRMTFFRIAAITAGVLVGIRELIMLFWVTVTGVILLVVASALILYLAYRHTQVLLNGQKK